MIRYLARVAIIGLTLPALGGLGGCALFGHGDVPPAPGLSGSAAQAQALREEIHRDPQGNTPTFGPLSDAQSAVAAARAQDRVNDYDAQSLDEARQALTQAQSGWQKIADNAHRSDQALAQVADDAHRAQRLAEIARYTAQREIGLDHLNQLQADQSSDTATTGNGGSALNAADGQLVNKRVVPVLLGSLEFQQGTARLTDESRPVIDKLAQLLKQHPALGVAVFGFTDNSAPPDGQLKAFINANPQLAQQQPSHAQQVMAYRQGLSDARARDVAQLLVEAGIDPKRIGARGLRDQHPIASNDSAAGRRRNERAEAIMVPLSAMNQGSDSGS